MNRRAAALVLIVPMIVSTIALLVGLAQAEHTLYYRYVLVGYVKDAKGRPVRGRSLELVRDKTGFSYLGDTDDKGFYVIVARLGDESEGEALTLKTGGRSTRLVAHFQAANHTDDRGTRVDVENGRFVERAAWFRSTLANFLGTTARP
ncbi:MAG: hypothetical protein HY294_00355 [Candidatus Rokubacteria bacterium]|nr:hypothetical protein [Candidatus Rokubacteria bacterium]MBI3824430.1 hypothetical protein [Candidatus Rokubacteria bacterium]